MILLPMVQNVLQVDGYVTTKFATVGTDVSVHANVRGADSSNTLVTADILHYRDLDPLDAFNGVSPSILLLLLTQLL